MAYEVTHTFENEDGEPVVINLEIGVDEATGDGINEPRYDACAFLEGYRVVSGLADWVTNDQMHDSDFLIGLIETPDEDY